MRINNRSNTNGKDTQRGLDKARCNNRLADARKSNALKKATADPNVKG